MAKESATLRNAVDDAFAQMAKAAIDRALDRIKYDACQDADKMMTWAETWLRKSSARAINRRVL